MKVLTAGDSGSVGRPLHERPVRAGHEVTSTVRSAEGAGRLRQLGTEPAESLAVLVADRAAASTTDDRRGSEP